MSYDMWVIQSALTEDRGLDNGKRSSIYKCINPLNNSITWFRCRESGRENIMMHFLQQLLIIVHPLLISRSIRVDMLEEVGYKKRYHGRASTYEEEGEEDGMFIQIQLRKGRGLADMLSLGEILDIFCHELAHYWHRDHTDDFLRKWEELKSELEQDLGGLVKVSMHTIYTERLEALAEADRWLPPDETPLVPEYTRQPNATSMEAVERWENSRQMMLQSPLTFGVKDQV